MANHHGGSDAQVCIVAHSWLSAVHGLSDITVAVSNAPLAKLMEYCLSAGVLEAKLETSEPLINR